jgi:hypothetical protein
VEVETKTKYQESYIMLGKLYVEKDFLIHFEEESKFVRVTNRNEQHVLVQVSLEKEPKDLK